MSKLLVIIVAVASTGLFSGYWLHSNTPDTSQEAVVSNQQHNFPEYLMLENGKLFCEYGNKKIPFPEVGIEYSRQNVSIVSSPQTLQIINRQYAKDQDRVYFYESICDEGQPASCDCSFSPLALDPHSFEILDDHHIKDNNQVIIFGSVATAIDAKSFELITTNNGEKTPYGKDKSNIYHYGYIVEGADYDSFEVISQSRARDKNNAYEEGDLVKKISPSI